MHKINKTRLRVNKGLVKVVFVTTSKEKSNFEVRSSLLQLNIHSSKLQIKKGIPGVGMYYRRSGNFRRGLIFIGTPQRRNLKTRTFFQRHIIEECRIIDTSVKELLPPLHDARFNSLSAEFSNARLLPKLYSKR